MPSDLPLGDSLLEQRREGSAGLTGSPGWAETGAPPPPWSQTLPPQGLAPSPQGPTVCLPAAHTASGIPPEPRPHSPTGWAKALE